MPRPTKLNDAVQDRIVATLRAGNLADSAARPGGIATATYYEWLARGRAELEHREHGRPPRRREDPYVAFLQAVERASADAEVHAVAIIRRAMHNDWRAAAWFLERRYPQRWRRRQSHDIEHHGSDVEPPVQIVAGVGRPEHTKAAHDFLRALRDTGVAGTGG